jgi:hypothetical protein
MARVKHLEDMARDMVGDNKAPNLFFVTNEAGNVIAVITDITDAIEFAKTTGAYLVEDRKSGEVWGSRAYHDVQRSDDYDS